MKKMPLSGFSFRNSGIFYRLGYSVSSVSLVMSIW